MTRHIFIFITLIFVLHGGNVFAQTTSQTAASIANAVYKSSISITPTPTAPQPGEAVQVEINSSTADLERSEITWNVNGVTKYKQIGLKKINIIAGKLGELTTISVTAVTPVGQSITSKTNFTAQETDLIWQANTFTPPFYKGKAMFTTQSDLQIIAIPHIALNGKEGSSGSQIYTWERDGAILGDQSGYGRNVLSLSSIDLPRDVHIKITASNYDNTAKSVGIIVIPPVPPKAIFYEDQPRFGVLLNKALVGDATMKDQEIHLIAYPYFFSAGTSDEDWDTDGVQTGEIMNGFNHHSIVLRNSDNKTGTSLIQLSLKNIGRFLQNADAELNLEFTSKDTKTTTL